MTNSNDASGPSSPKPKTGHIARQNAERLATALSLSNEAVQLDTANCEEAIEAYTACLKLIDEVDCSMASHREELIASGRPDSGQIKAMEATLEKLQAITRTYTDRRRTLCDAYNIDSVTLTRRREPEEAHAVFDALAAYKSAYPVRVRSKL